MAKRLFDRMAEEAEVPLLKQKFKPMEKERWVDEYQDMINRMDHSLEGNLFDSSETKQIMDDTFKVLAKLLKKFLSPYVNKIISLLNSLKAARTKRPQKALSNAPAWHFPYFPILGQKCTV